MCSRARINHMLVPAVALLLLLTGFNFLHISRNYFNIAYQQTILFIQHTTKDIEADCVVEVHTNYSLNNLKIHCRKNLTAIAINTIPKQCLNYKYDEQYDINTLLKHNINGSVCDKNVLYPEINEENQWITQNMDVYFKEFIKFLQQYYNSSKYDYDSLNQLNILDYHEKYLSVVVTTYNRPNLVIESISRLVQCHPIIGSIHVVWNNVLMSPPHSFYISLNNIINNINIPIHIHLMSVNNLSNRFYPFASIKSNFIFSIDDDELINFYHSNNYNTTCSFLFANLIIYHFYPTQIIGNKYVKRCIQCNQNTNKFEYQNSKCHNKYCVMITGWTFLNKCMFYIYWSSKYNWVRDYILQTMNGEDIALNFIWSQYTNKPPLYIDFPDIKNLHQKGKQNVTSSTDSMFLNKYHWTDRADVAQELIKKDGFFFKFNQFLITTKNSNPTRNKMYQQYLSFMKKL